jgi:hypothetical protein
MRDDEVVWC